MMTINNHKFTNADNTNGFIYLVRDPRDVLISYTLTYEYKFRNDFKIL